MNKYPKGFFFALLSSLIIIQILMSPFLVRYLYRKKALFADVLEYNNAIEEINESIEVLADCFNSTEMNTSDTKLFDVRLAKVEMQIINLERNRVFQMPDVIMVSERYYDITDNMWAFREAWVKGEKFETLFKRHQDFIRELNESLDKNSRILKTAIFIK